MTERSIFHKIIDRELPATIVYEDDEVLAFKDIHPKAATHLLFIPKQFVESIAHVTTETAHIPGMLIEKARFFAGQQGITDYKLTYHLGKYAIVPYLHLHFLSEETLE